MAEFVNINGIYYNVYRIQSFWYTKGQNLLSIKFVGSRTYDSFADPNAEVYNLLVRKFSVESRKVLNG